MHKAHPLVETESENDLVKCLLARKRKDRLTLSESEREVLCDIFRRNPLWKDLSNTYLTAIAIGHL